MRRRLNGSLTVAAVAVFTLAGCVAVVTPPPAPTEEEAAVRYEQILDQSWASTSVSDFTTRPIVVAGEPLPYVEWATTIFLCMQDKGFANAQLRYDPGAGYHIDGSGDATSLAADPAAQLAFFECLARRRYTADRVYFASDAQLQYTYEHFRDEVVPCMASNGVAPTSVPSRDQFLAGGGSWSPYAEAVVGSGPGDIYQHLIDLCGPELPALY